MLTIILVLLVILLILGYIQIPFLPLHDINLITVFGKTITLYDLFIFLLLVWVIDLLPWPFRGIAMAIFILWLLTFFGIIAISGFSNLLVLALIIGIIAYLFQGFTAK